MDTAQTTNDDGVVKAIDEHALALVTAILVVGNDLQLAQQGGRPAYSDDARLTMLSNRARKIIEASELL